MKSFETVEEVCREDLCTGCGTCVGVCPTGALEIREDRDGFYTPILDHHKCDKCGLCVQVCPGHAIDYDDLNKIIFGRSPRDVFLGNFVNGYIGHSTDKRIRYNSASGGIATELLSYLLEKRIVDGAIVVKMDEFNPLRPVVFIAHTKEEITSASGSKYCPVPINVLLKEVMQNDEKLAIVGLPCHIHGLRKAELLWKDLREKIILRVGLFCARTFSFIGTRILLKKIGVTIEDVMEIEYRGRGWPGKTTIKLRDDRRKTLPYETSWKFLCSTFLYRLRCILCSDQTNELADISLGDAWLPQLRGSKLGESIILTRTEVGEELLKDCSKVGRINIAKIDSVKVIQSQKEALYSKKRKIKARINILNAFGRKVPSIHSRLIDPTMSDYLHSVMILFGISLSSIKVFRILLEYLPISIWENSLFKIFGRYGSIQDESS